MNRRWIVYGLHTDSLTTTCDVVDAETENDAERIVTEARMQLSDDYECDGVDHLDDHIAYLESLRRLSPAAVAASLTDISDT